MWLGSWVHAATRRYGFDVYNHMAGGRAFPFRVWSVPAHVLPRTDTGRTLKSFEVEIERCTSFVGFSYRTGGWNPHVETLREFIADPSLRYEDSSLYRVHQAFVPRTLQELFLEDQQAPMEPLSWLPTLRRLFRHVWAISPAVIKNVELKGRDLDGHQYFGPMPSAKGQIQFARLLTVFRSIEQAGFKPDLYGPVKGYFLADDSTYRFVVGSGNHRLAILKVLGHKRVQVELNQTHPAVVHRSQLATWTINAGGPFEPDTTYALFNKLMIEGGMDKARNVGVVGPNTEDRSNPR